MTSVYIYEHWRPDTNTCFYVGKGAKKRAWNMKARNKHHKAIVSKLTSLGLAVDVRIIIDGLSEESAFLVERDLILKYGIKNLANMTYGGEGISGFKNPASDLTKQKISKAKKGKPSNRKGAVLSDESKQKIRIANLGKKLSTDTKHKLSVAKKGKPPNNAGKPVSLLTKQKLSLKNKGRKHTEEARAKIKAAWVVRKASL